MEAMHDRLKLIRDHKKMNQTDFAKLLGIATSSLGMMEVGKRAIQDRHVKLICSICSVNENWFRNGEGPMLIEPSTNSLGQLSIEYSLNDIDQAILRIYINLPPEHRKLLFQIAKQVVEATETIDTSSSKSELERAADEVEEYI